jgi:diguanylate cyclase (GGDEF)-like protein
MHEPKTLKSGDMVRQEQEGSIHSPASANGTTPLRIILCDNDMAERLLIGSYLQRQTYREIMIEETDRVSEVKATVDRGKVDLVIMDIDTPEEARYWLEMILESRSAPVVALTQREIDKEMQQLVREGLVSPLFKDSLSRDELVQTIDSTLKRWYAIRRSYAHEAELERLANQDSLTNLLNRRSVLHRLEECAARARRYGEAVSVLLLDIDRFERAREVLGRTGADAALQRIAALLQRRIREADFVGRYGRDEFLIIYTHTDLDSAQVAAERIRKLIEALEFGDKEDSLLSVTVSGGMAAYETGDDVSTLTYRAESALCKAKENGRNRIEM